MNKEERNARIEEKHREIKRLQEEIKDLRCGSIRTLAKKELIIGFFINKDGEPEVRTLKTDYSDVWTHIRELSTKMFMKKEENFATWAKVYYGVPKKKIKQDEMTEEQIKLSAEFADEVISLYNKYVLKANNPFWVNGKAYTVPIDCKAVEGLIESEEER